MIQNVGILKFKPKKGLKLIIPHQSTFEFAKLIHETLHHPGITSTYLTLVSYFEVNNLQKTLKEVKKTCLNCMLNQRKRTKEGKVSGFICSQFPWEKCCVDILGPLDTTTLTNKKGLPRKLNLLVIVDVHSRWTKIGILHGLHTNVVIKTFHKIWLKKYPTPKVLISDGGPQFISSLFEDFLAEFEIRHIKTTSYNPTSNGIVERKNQEILKTFRLYRNEEINAIIKITEDRINLVSNSRYGLSPSEIINGWSFLDPLQRNLSGIIKHANELDKKEKIKNQRERNRRRTSFNYELNSLVLVKNHLRNKLAQRYRGPYEIVGVSDDKNVFSIKEENKITKQNVKNIFPWKGRMK